jgi:hypothetical protein
VWKEKYNFLKEMAEKGGENIAPLDDSSEIVLDLNNRIIELDAQLKKFKSKYDNAIMLAEKSIAELKKRKK